MDTLTGYYSSLSMDFGLIMVREEIQSTSGLIALRTRSEGEQTLWKIDEQFTSLWMDSLVVSNGCF